MRQGATKTELKIRESIGDFLSTILGRSWHIEPDVSDRPDIVIVTSDGRRIGIEITRLSYEKFMKWLSFKTPMNCRREAKVNIDLDKQLSVALKQKNPKYHEYRRAQRLNEVWLCLHNNLYEFNTSESTAHLSAELFSMDAAFYCRKHACKFDHVIFFAENSGQYLHLFEKSKRLTYWKTSGARPFVHFTEMAGKMTAQGLHFNESFTLVDKKTFGD